MSLTEDLRRWRRDRNITNNNTKVYIANVIEELLELLHTDKNIIEAKQRDIMEYYFDLEPIGDKEHIVDCIQDIQVFSINETELMGYDNELCNKEVYKHINSRKQCPKQKEEWSMFGASGKWLKSELPDDKKLWYRANYNKCKIT